jgi:hypothetical protein
MLVFAGRMARKRHIDDLSMVGTDRVLELELVGQRTGVTDDQQTGEQQHDRAECAVAAVGSPEAEHVKGLLHLSLLMQVTGRSR